MSAPRIHRQHFFTSRLTVRVAAAVLAIIASTIAPARASAQLGGLGRRATDAMQRKANQKVDEKIDKAAQKLVDHSFDSVFGPDDSGKSGSGSSSSNGGSSRIFAMLPNAPTEDHYDFDAVITYEVQRIHNGKSDEDNGLITMNFNSDGKSAGFKIASAKPKKGDGDVFAIFDVKNESMVMLMNSDDGKASMAYSWKDAKKYAQQMPQSSGGAVSTVPAPEAAPNAKPMTFTSLGKKTIAGYSADGYKGENEDGNVEVWVSKDSKIAYGTMMGASGSMKQMRGVTTGANYPVGMMLEITSTDRKTGDKGIMTATSIDPKAKVHINMGDYPRIGAAAK